MVLAGSATLFVLLNALMSILIINTAHFFVDEDLISLRHSYELLLRSFVTPITNQYSEKECNSVDGGGIVEDKAYGFLSG